VVVVGVVGVVGTDSVVSGLTYDSDGEVIDVVDVQLEVSVVVVVVGGTGWLGLVVVTLGVLVVVDGLGGTKLTGS